MLFNDPTLYGATLPQREIPVNAPFANPYLAQWQNLPFQNVQWQNFQKFIPQTHGMVPPVPQGYGMLPPVPQGYGMIPPVPQGYGMIPPVPQGYGVTQPFCGAPPQTAFNPYLQGSFYNPSLPFYGWQRPLTY